MAGVSVLCAALVLVLIGWLLRRAQGNWLAPGPLFAAYWAVFVAAPSLFAPQFHTSQGAVWYVVALVAAASLGSWVAERGRPVREPGVEPPPLDQRILRLLVVAGTVAGVVASAVIQRANGQSIGSVLSLRTLLDAASSLAADRYTLSITTPAVVPLLLALTYAAALVAPFAAEGLSRAWVLACYLGPLLGATVYASVTTARAGMLTASLFLLTGWVAARIRRTGRTPDLRGRAVLAGAVSAGLLLAAFVAIAFLRVGSFTGHYQRLVFAKLAIYGFGYLPAFSDWLGRDAPTGPSSWGSASFAGVAKYLGGDPSYGSAIGGFAPIGSGQSSNIFTGWRYLVQDFGMVGAPLAALALGYVVTAAWGALIRRPRTTPLVVLICGYGYFLHTNTLPVFTFTNVVVAVLLAGVALHLGPRPPQRASLRSGRPGLARPGTPQVDRSAPPPTGTRSSASPTRAAAAAGTRRTRLGGSG